MRFILTSFTLVCMLIISNIVFGNVKINNHYNKNDIKRLIIANAKLTKYVSPSLGLAVAEAESSFNPNAVSPKGAIGIMQIMPLTAKKKYGIEKYKLYDPEINIKVGLHFLDSLIKRYKGRVDIALSHYNGGSAVGVWPKVKIIPFTYSYVVKVLKKSAKFKKYNKNIIRTVNSQNVAFDPYKELNNNLASVDQWLKIFDDYKKIYN